MNTNKILVLIAGLILHCGCLAKDIQISTVMTPVTLQEIKQLDGKSLADAGDYVKSRVGHGVLKLIYSDMNYLFASHANKDSRNLFVFNDKLKLGACIKNNLLQITTGKSTTEFIDNEFGSYPTPYFGFVKYITGNQFSINEPSAPLGGGGVRLIDSVQTFSFDLFNQYWRWESSGKTLILIKSHKATDVNVITKFLEQETASSTLFSGLKGAYKDAYIKSTVDVLLKLADETKHDPDIMLLYYVEPLAESEIMEIKTSGSTLVRKISDPVLK